MIEQKKTAIIIGATGLIGRYLTRFLLKNQEYSLVKVFARSSTDIEDEKLQEYMVDFDQLANWQEELKGDELFSTMGTTRKKAGKQGQYKVDFTYQYEVAKAAANNGVSKYLLVSSAGANAESNSFYSRIKGELEANVSALDFKYISIFRPSILVGQRSDNRLGEKIGIKVGQWLTRLPAFKKYRPIKGETVAKAMMNAATGIPSNKVKIYAWDEIHLMGL